MIQQNEFMPAQWPYNINQRPYPKKKKKKKPENSNFLAKQSKCSTMAFAQETGECLFAPKIMQNISKDLADLMLQSDIDNPHRFYLQCGQKL